MTTNSIGTANGADKAPPAVLPMFYKKPRPLDSRVHSQVSLKRDIKLDFARGTNSIPLTAQEFASAAAYYPIVFAADPMPEALAVVGLNPAENLYIDDQGRWRTAYVPAYVRRYPFIFLQADKEQRQLMLCIDETEDTLEGGQSQPLFDAEGKQTEAVEKALRFCIDFQRNHAATNAFVEALKARDLLTERTVNIALAGGQKINLGGFRVVDEERFNALPDDVYLEWRRQGWIGLVYAHFLSMSGWSKLGELMAARLKAPAQRG